MYADARGVSRDYGEAATWLRRAAEQGVDDAGLKLSGMYANAYLVASMTAAQTGEGEFASIARQMRDALADKMTPG